MGTAGIKVCLLTGEFPPQVGGVGDYTHHLATALSTIGLQVEVFTSPSSSYRSPVLAETAESHLYRLHRIIMRWDFHLLGQTEALIDELQPDIVHIQYQTGAYGMHPAIAFLPRWLRWRRPSVRTITTFHDFRDPYLFPKAGPLRSLVTGQLVRGSQGVIVTNPEDEEVLLKHLGQDELDHRLNRRSVVVIPIGPNVLPSGNAGQEQAQLRAGWGIPEGDYLVGFYGLPHPSKGLETLFKTLQLLRAKGQPVSLIMIGGEDDSASGSAYKQRLQLLAESEGLGNSVHWTGYLPAESVAHALSALVCCVLPFSEGANYRHGTLVTTLAHGVPLVTTYPRPSSTHLKSTLTALPPLEDGVHCRLVPPASPDQLAEAILALLRAAQERERLASGARELARAFAWDTIAQQTAAFYEHMLPSSRA